MKRLDTVNLFLSEFTDVIQKKYGQKIDRLVLFGSASKGEWRRGSDVDLLVFLKGKSSRSMRKDFYDLFWSLNAKYDLGLGTAPCLHPPIMFMDNPFNKLVKKLVGKERRRPVTAALKKIAPRTQIVAPLFRLMS